MTLPPAGAHGGDATAVARALGVEVSSLLDLSASLNPVAPDVTAVVARHLDAVRRYPDPTAATAALASAMDVDASTIVLTNGGSEAISLVARHRPGRVDEPEFSLLPRHGDARWRSNPNNPTGLLAPAGARADVWDEAFWPLATGSWTRGDLDSGAAAIVGSLTKLLSCPGLRVGYVASHDERLLDDVRRDQPAWSVNGLVCSALPDLLDLVDLAGWAAAVASRRDDLTGVLRRAGLEPSPSDACWVLVAAPGLRERLGRRGVLVRDCASFGLVGWMRIAVPDELGLERLERALDV